MNHQSDRPDDYWKEKYLALADDEAGRIADFVAKEQLLTRAVVRLTFAASGLDPALDPHLQALRAIMQQELQTERLRQELDGLMETLIRIPPNDEATASDIQSAGRALLPFLDAQQVPAESRSALKILRDRIEAGDFQSVDQLYAAVARLLQAASPARPSPKQGLVGRLLGKPRDQALRAGEQALLGHLEKLLQAVKPPASLERRMNQLVRRVRQGDDSLAGLFDASSNLITEITAEYRKEQAELSGFLTEMSSRLGELENSVLGIDQLNAQSAANRRDSQRTVDHELATLRASATDATELAKLKDIVSDRLTAFAGHLDAYRQAEEVRGLETQRQLHDVTRRLRSLEQEADDLRTKLAFSHDAAFVDPLTSLPNQKAYVYRVQIEEYRWQRFRQALSLLVWDVDDFKQINQRFGFEAGDRALSFIGRILVSSIRNVDFIARHGGEKFVMLLVGTDETTAMDVAQEIRRKIESCEFTSGGKPVPITLSCGISEFKGRDGAGDVFERAEKALYQAKRKGRNRCEIAPLNL